LAKSAGTCFKPLTEIKYNSVSLRLNFYAYNTYRQSEEGFGSTIDGYKVQRVSVVYAKVYNFS